MKKLFSGLFTLRGELTKKQLVVFGTLGSVLSVMLWWSFATLQIIPKQVLPSPQSVLAVLPDLHFNNGLVENVWYTTKLNLLGFGLAILFSVPIGYLIGLLPIARGLSSFIFVGLRFIPLPVTTGLFMAFGIGDLMKIVFLAFAIFVYLVPTIVQRIDEVPQVYLNTLKTLGANRLQEIKYVFIPEVLSRVWDDIVILVGISWTYISIVELINTSDGGIGALMYIAQRQTSIEKVYAILVIIMIVAFLQTKLFQLFGDFIFPYKKIGR
jgi:NitT/TauT family transport system permease protein